MVAEGNSSDVTLEVYSLTSETHSCNFENEHTSTVPSLVTEKKKSKLKPDIVNTTPPVKDTTDDIIEDEDQILTTLLAAKTEKDNVIEDKLFKMTTMVDQTKTTLPDVIDEENDCLLEELLAQPI